MTTGELIWGDEGWAGPDFAHNAKQAVENSQLRRNVREATTTIRQRRAGLVSETHISGPSATVDIEMVCVKGVHGPRTLDVILVAADEWAHE